MRAAVALRPKAAELHLDLGLILADLRRVDEAAAAMTTALALAPDLMAAYMHLGDLLNGVGRIARAGACFQRAMAVDPSNALAHNALGVALVAAKRPREALAAYRRAVALEPGFTLALGNLGNALGRLGYMAASGTAYRWSLATTPAPVVHSNYVYNLLFDPETTPSTLLMAAEAYGARFADRLTARARPARNRPEPERTINVGFVSPDLRSHSVAHFVEPLFRHHDRRRFRFFAYHSHVEDHVSQRLKRCVHAWSNVVALNDGELAARIHADNIDVLVDLSGHTSDNRLIAFALKPAPVQVSWLGFPGTVGMRAIDWRLVDRFVEPEGEAEKWSTERLWRLPHAHFCYQPAPSGPEPAARLPLDGNGFVTFGSLNGYNKINGGVIAAWAAILRAVPRARMVIKATGLDEAVTRETLLARFAAEGVGADRLDVRGWAPEHPYATYLDIDLCLDTFPYNGATTTMDALWMGVPVVGLVGRQFAGRVGAAVLTNLGLDQLLAPTAEDYVAVAVRLATEPERLRQLRIGLRQRLETSPLMDGPAFARAFESGLRGMWRQWCATASGVGMAIASLSGPAT